MTNGVMVCLVGEQPLPNLLPIRYDEPAEVVLVHTEKTREVCCRLDNVLRSRTQVHLLPVNRYNIPETRDQLAKFIGGRGWKYNNIAFNITGGTKAMAIAAYLLAQEWRCRFLYLESEESQSRVFRYRFGGGSSPAVMERDEVIRGVISLDDYLIVHLGHYQLARTPQDAFEQTVLRILQPHVDEALPRISCPHWAGDMDLVLRVANQVAIAEVKDTLDSGKIHMGLRQLLSSARRESLGTYCKRLFVLGKPWPRDQSNWKEFAQDSEIRIIELPSYDRQSMTLSNEDAERLIREVRESLGG